MVDTKKVVVSATYKQLVLSFKVGLFIQFIQSWKQREIVYIVCLYTKKRQRRSFSSDENVQHSAL